MNLRPARPEDAEIIASMHTACWRAAYRGVVSDEFLSQLDVRETTRRMASFLSTPGPENVIVEVDGESVGFATFGARRDEDLDETIGELWGLYLVPEHWREGIGRSVLRDIESRLAARAYDAVVLWTFERNAAARGFYEAMGYRADGATRAFDLGGPCPAIRMRKRLDR